MLNLLGNAIKFTEQGEILLEIEIASQITGKLPVLTSKSSKTEKSIALHFSVSDKGIGIPEDKLEDIFESFTQVDGSISRKHGGTGLGLAICKQLVEIMMGHIWVESTEGRGSTFHFITHFDIGHELLPDRTPKNTIDYLATKSVIDDVNLANVKILLAEDDQINQEVVVNILNKYGYRVSVVRTGKEAVLLLKEKDFDLVFMDLQMPEMGGIEATKLIRKSNSRNKNVHIIALTAHAKKSDRDRCLAAGMNEYLSKPIDVNLLLQSVRKATQKKYTSKEDQSALKKEDERQISPGKINTLKIDKDTALARLNGDVSLYHHICNTFLSTAPDLLIKIDNALEEKDIERSALNAHSLKSAAGNIGAEQLKVVAEQLEKAAQKEDFLNAKKSYKRLKNEIDSVVDMLQGINEQAFMEV
jgi:CheY-like chemotaxis protein/HPt (histidine-containing phosphotransfer) domain-containing protein